MFSNEKSHVNRWNAKIEKEVHSQLTSKRNENKRRNLFLGISQEIENLQNKWKSSTDAQSKEVLNHLMNSAGRSFSYLQIKKTALKLLPKLRHLFSMIENHMTRMDVWLLSNEIKSLTEMVDSFFYDISVLKPYSTSHARFSIKEATRIHDEKVQKIFTAIKKWQNALKTSLPISSLPIKDDYKRYLAHSKKLFVMNNFKYGNLIEGKKTKKKKTARMSVPSRNAKKVIVFNDASVASNDRHERVFAKETKVVQYEIVNDSNNDDDDDDDQNSSGSTKEPIANRSKSRCSGAKGETKSTLAEYFARRKVLPNVKLNLKHIVHQNTRKRKRMCIDMDDDVTKTANGELNLMNASKKVRLACRA